ncbi:unnamed protein product [Thelazia callipaeda]|uniref:Gamma-glutamylcyclotransferase family protein n=1 Tax=Thelazia callipaeda TaxID=103827 RepID=A0A0N5D2D7_THECL|nr:unnamed protein product [Thelazia callipaeda]
MSARKLNHQILVFVYGTLKQGEPNAAIMTDLTFGKQKFLGKGKTVKKYPLIVASRFNIPFCLDQPGIGHNYSGHHLLKLITVKHLQHVTGEVYQVDEKKLIVLDEFEAHPSFYERKLREVKMDCSGAVLKAWIYLLTKWKSSLLQECSTYLETYNSDGPHFRPYIKSYFGVGLCGALDKKLNE